MEVTSQADSQNTTTHKLVSDYTDRVVITEAIPTKKKNKKKKKKGKKDLASIDTLVYNGIIFYIFFCICSIISY